MQIKKCTEFSLVLLELNIIIEPGKCLFFFKNIFNVSNVNFTNKTPFCYYGTLTLRYIFECNEINLNLKASWSLFCDKVVTVDSGVMKC